MLFSASQRAVAFLGNTLLGRKVESLLRELNVAKMEVCVRACGVRVRGPQELTARTQKGAPSALPGLLSLSLFDALLRCGHQHPLLRAVQLNVLQALPGERNAHDQRVAVN